jgi:hypothetical protein
MLPCGRDTQADPHMKRQLPGRVQPVHRSEAAGVDADRLELGGAAEVRCAGQDRLVGGVRLHPEKDVARVSMKLDTLPFDVDQWTWSFIDMTRDGGKVALMWGTTLASPPFKAVASR